MNPGICYVYEYDNNQRKRNAGFLKIVRHYQSCILQIHVRGLPLGNGTTLELCAFYLSGRNMVGATVASLTCFSRSISVRLPVSESHFPEHRPLSEIDGFLIRLPGSRDTVFWAASEKDLNMDPAHMILPGDPKTESPVQEVPPAAKSTKLQENSPTSGTAFPPAGAPAPEASHFPENTPTEENHSSQEASLPQEENLPQENTLHRKTRSHTKKISHREALSPTKKIFPRKIPAHRSLPLLPKRPSRTRHLTPPGQKPIRQPVSRKKAPALCRPQSRTAGFLYRPRTPPPPERSSVPTSRSFPGASGSWPTTAFSFMAVTTITTFSW